jgi:hypothetical protein
VAAVKRLGGLIVVVLTVAAAGVVVWQWRESFFAGRLMGPPPATGTPLDRVAWIAAPGQLARAHADLSGTCSRCHVPFLQPADTKCLDCHAKDTQLLERLSTRFHADARNCVACHTEHQGRAARITRMEHGVLAESVACTSCHVDRHREVFGARCADCHGTETWRVVDYRHPAPSSQLCAECHRPPKSHLMMHFTMIDRAVSRQHDASVDQCWRCHAIEDWNEIKGVGRYVHH